MKFLAVKTLTKAAVAMDTLKVKKVTYADGILSVTVKDEQGKIDAAFYKVEQSYSGCLVIGNGNSDNTSGFFPLTYKQVVEDLTPDVFYQWTSATPPTDTVQKVTCTYNLKFDSNGNVYSSNNTFRAVGYSVRCLKEE